MLTLDVDARCPDYIIGALILIPLSHTPISHSETLMPYSYHTHFNTLMLYSHHTHSNTLMTFIPPHFVHP